MAIIDQVKKECGADVSVSEKDGVVKYSKGDKSHTLSKAAHDAMDPSKVVAIIADGLRGATAPTVEKK